MWCQRMPQQMWCRSVSDVVLHFADVAALFENGITAPITLKTHTTLHFPLSLNQKINFSLTTDGCRLTIVGCRLTIADCRPPPPAAAPPLPAHRS
ncbi:hypothetical protein Tco_0315229 [Tanacetum coccineum]